MIIRHSRLLLIPILVACHYLVGCKEKIEIKHRAPTNLNDQHAQGEDTTKPLKPEDFAKEFERLKKEHKDDEPAVQEAPSEELDNLVFVDMFAPDYTTQHPLIGHSSGGQDMAFKHVVSGETFHAVFPKGVSAPEALNGHFALQGHYQVAPAKHTKDISLVKMIPKDYRYFVVSSWTTKELEAEQAAPRNR